MKQAISVLRLKGHEITEEEEEAGVLAKVRNRFYEIILVSTGTNADGEAEGKFVFTAREDYSAENVESTLTVSNPYVKFLLKVDQENSSREDWTDGGKQPWRP